MVRPACREETEHEAEDEDVHDTDPERERDAAHEAEFRALGEEHAIERRLDRDREGEEREGEEAVAAVAGRTLQAVLDPEVVVFLLGVAGLAQEPLDLALPGDVALLEPRDRVLGLVADPGHVHGGIELGEPVVLRAQMRDELIGEPFALGPDVGDHLLLGGARCDAVGGREVRAAVGLAALDQAALGDLARDVDRLEGQRHEAPRCRRVGHPRISLIVDPGAGAPVHLPA